MAISTHALQTLVAVCLALAKKLDEFFDMASLFGLYLLRNATLQPVLLLRYMHKLVLPTSVALFGYALASIQLAQNQAKSSLKLHIPYNKRRA
jgi:hypothetical protein